MHPSNLSTWTDRARALIRSEAGTAPLEFIVAGILMLVPLFYLVVALAAVQSQTMGVESASRSIARSLAMTDDATSDVVTQRVLATITAQYGIDPDTVAVTITCTGGTGVCPSPGAIVQVTVSARAELPLMPPILNLDGLTSIPVSATSVQKVATS